MRLVLGIIVGFLLGGIGGYVLGVEVACGLLDLGNLCGLIGVFVTGPLGALGGSIAGALLTRRRAGAAG